jgi:hypothetical protein
MKGVGCQRGSCDARLQARGSSGPSSPPRLTDPAARRPPPEHPAGCSGASPDAHRSPPARRGPACRPEPEPRLPCRSAGARATGVALRGAGSGRAEPGRQRAAGWLLIPQLPAGQLPSNRETLGSRWSSWRRTLPPRRRRGAPLATGARASNGGPRPSVALGGGTGLQDDRHDAGLVGVLSPRACPARTARPRRRGQCPPVRPWFLGRAHSLELPARRPRVAGRPSSSSPRPLPFCVPSGCPLRPCSSLGVTTAVRTTLVGPRRPTLGESPVGRRRRGGPSNPDRPSVVGPRRCGPGPSPGNPGRRRR